MKTRPFILVTGLIGLAALAALGWYLLSPLFIDRSVEEAFPFELPEPSELAQMSEAELDDLLGEFMTAIPSEGDLAEISEQDRLAVQEKVMEVAATMPAHSMEEPMPAGEQPSLIIQGQFQDADSFHQGSGQAAIYRLPSGLHILRFEGFSVTNGPDLHVLLATGAAPTDRSSLGDYLDLGSLKGNLGSQNYEIPQDADISQYKSVVIYCQPFHVVFAIAILK